MWYLNLVIYWNIGKVQGVWLWLLNLLRQEGMDNRVSALFCWEVIHL